MCHTVNKIDEVPGQDKEQGEVGKELHQVIVTEIHITQNFRLVQHISPIHKLIAENPTHLNPYHCSMAGKVRA